MVNFLPLHKQSLMFSSRSIVICRPVRNLPQFNITVIVLQAPSYQLADLKPLVHKVVAILPTLAKGQATVVSTYAAILTE